MARSSDQAEPASSVLDALAQSALDVARKAAKHKKSLSGDNFYGNKLAQLRTDASNAFSQMSAGSVGDTSAIAELIDASFSPSTSKAERLASVRELSHALRTKWKEQSTGSTNPGNELFPLALIAKTGRGYLVTITRQMNGSMGQRWYDACAVMMRRLIELVVIEAFEHHSIEAKIKDGSGNYVHLSELIDAALREPSFKLSRNAKTALPKLRNVGHRSAHGRYFTAQQSDIENVEDGVRVVVEEFLNHAGLL
ncbi:hypothetical protein [Bradyrhizobium diazoefficiens]|uniref:DUF4145 domain-containing protein n=1 Tax=Bradyrhizobium diazoefficiens TaxID=1355477 RepID=A0A809ZIJ7_9BRAD|nr:hypothetical protein [Bradyrhizobium diazoefficiens]WLA74785.1 hypothetical protein QIH77_06205 [Bradyrhizobium diazoefficiens]BCE25977.1 hypothetical protein XF1B_86580 [Bradyrhizobium diazoefficiens]BCE52234.1 hypothetical protein XF4B_85830 [Bradyrhizobium diazoefficiens]BCE95727.1 hypothetical protein XF10B_85250 [Bradyrhizobium diazoefficiens]BCF30677.1 hypothetical protein XF14B_86290 [Bradyrhizobium diazoefficiens]